jgi:hypothetical protein
MGSVPEIGVRARFLIFVCILAAGPAFPQERVLQLPNGEELRYRAITDSSESARPAAMELLQHLAAGELEAAAALSNAPQRRLEVLQDFRRSIGEEEFKRLFGRYFAPENRIVMEAAIGKRRLLVWDLGEAGHQLAGQYYVELDGKFVMDDVPNDERSKLQRILEAQRKKANSGSGS